MELFSTHSTILFDHNSDSVVSPVFVVPPGYISLLSLFGMNRAFKGFEDGTYEVSCIKVQKVIMSGHAIPQTNGSCGSPSLQQVLDKMPRNAVDRFEDVMQKCGHWTIDPCSNYAAITVPGAFQLKVADDAQLGEFYVEQVTMKIQDAAMIPMGFILGS